MASLSPDLEQLSREGDGSFLLPLADRSEVVCADIVRRVPGRRLVCRGEWQGQPVFAKIFVGPHAARYAKRDARGVRALTAAGILTPDLLWEGEVSGHLGQVLIYRLIENADNAEAVWHAGDPARRRQLAQALVTLAARLHAAGLVQTDLYLRNFLCRGDEIFTLDGDGIRISGTAVARRASMTNLALLLSKFDLETLQDLPGLWSAYLRQRGWQEDTRDLDRLEGMAWQTRRRVAQAYAGKKVFRNCTDVRVVRTFDRYLAVMREQQSADLDALLDDIDARMTSGEAQALKLGNTCTVGRVTAGERQWVVKRYNIKNFWHGLNRALRRTRASVSWTNAHLLRIYGLRTPAPVALLERRFGWLRRQSYFLAEYVEGPDIGEFLADDRIDPALKSRMAHAMADLLHRLYLLGLEHGDMKASNIRIVDGQPLLIDLDGMRQHARSGRLRRRHSRDLRRFLKNWHNAPEIAEMMLKALQQVYGSDPVLNRMGITQQT